LASTCTGLSAIQYSQSIQVASTPHYVGVRVLHVKRLGRRHRIQPFRRRRNDFKVRVVRAPCRPFHSTSYIVLLLFVMRSYLVLLAWPRSVYLFGHRSPLYHSHPHLPSTLSSIRLEIYGTTIASESIGQLQGDHHTRVVLATKAVTRYWHTEQHSTSPYSYFLFLRDPRSY